MRFKGTYLVSSCPSISSCSPSSKGSSFSHRIRQPNSQAALCTRAEDRSEKNKEQTIAHAVYWRRPTKAVLSWSSFRSIPPENIGWRDGNWTTTFCLREGMEKMMPARAESTCEEEEYVPFHISCHYWISSGANIVTFSVRSVPLCSCPIPWTSLRTPLSYGLCYTWRGNFWLHFCELGNSENVWEREGSARSVEARGAAGWESFNDEEEVEGNHREGYWRRKMDEGARSVITVRWIYNRNFGDYCFTQFHLGIWRCPGTTTLDSN